MSLSHSNSPLFEHCSEDKRIVLKSEDSRGKTSGGVVSDNTVGSSEKPYARESIHTWRRNRRKREIFCFTAGRELPGNWLQPQQSTSPYVHLAGKISEAAVSVLGARPLLRPVRRLASAPAGSPTSASANDPWARSWCCYMCDGTGEVIAGCECCREDATERFDGLLLCEVCAASRRRTRNRWHDPRDARLRGLASRHRMRVALRDAPGRLS